MENLKQMIQDCIALQRQAITGLMEAQAELGALVTCACGEPLQWCEAHGRQCCPACEQH